MDYDKLTKAELIEKLEKQKHLSADVDAKNKEISKLIDNVDKLNEVIDNLVEQNKKISNIANQHIQAFRSLMKSIQGSLENAIELEALITEKIK